MSKHIENVKRSDNKMLIDFLGDDAENIALKVISDQILTCTVEFSLL